MKNLPALAGGEVKVELSFRKRSEITSVLIRGLLSK